MGSLRGKLFELRCLSMITLPLATQASSFPLNSFCYFLMTKSKDYSVKIFLQSFYQCYYLTKNHTLFQIPTKTFS